ncbi:hypothetical protein C6P45_003094 [Maudiozyma exigua]|uniref:Uncharacterized protein n=1 Tax=Maudiozyma exigua TaxID=34358 RepID=A0A9P6WDD0_MAUEX|nr:hypothetical protein C6P45_003094 [Kazachstania exigua]
MKNDILIFNINNWEKYLTSKDGYCCLMNVNNNCCRFDENWKEIVLELESGSSIDHRRELLLHIYLFKRQPRKEPVDGKVVYGQRTRSIIDPFQCRLNDVTVTTIRETYTDWNRIDVTFPIVKACVQLSIEFYPASPILPDKLTAGTTVEDGELPYCMNLTVTHDLVVKSQELPRNVMEEVTSNISQPRRRLQPSIQTIGKFVKNIIHKPKQKHQSVENVTTDDYLYLDIDNPRASYTDSRQSSDLNDFQESVHTSLIEDELDIDQPMKISNYHILPLDATAKTFFKNFENRIIYNQNIDWTNIFEPSNVRTTGYIGNGKWVSSQVSGALLFWYLQEHVKSIKPPKRPPKFCPKGVLWEEYYLMNQNELLQQYSR